MTQSVSGPLSGLMVVDLAQFVAGSYCTLLLGDLGADVVKVELPPDGDPYRRQGPQYVDGEGVLFLALNRNKRSVALNWKRPKGRDPLLQLIEKADVLVENARPGALASYGLDYETLAASYPQLIYCSISGYGQTGPHSQRGGFDLILQGEGGLMSITGEKGGAPVKVGAPILDIGAAMTGLAALLSALHARSMTQRGAHVESSLLDFSMATLTTVAQSYFAGGAVPGRMGSASPQFAPYQAYRTAGQSITIAGTGSETLWERLCQVLGRADLAADPRYKTNADRVRHQESLAKEIELTLLTLPHQEWLARFARAEIPAGPINNLHELLEDPHIADRQCVLDVNAPGRQEIQSIAAPMRLGDASLPVRMYPPRFGEHTLDILHEIGYSDEAISELAAEGSIACA